MLATGGDDCVVRVFKLGVADYKTSEKLYELTGHFDNINAVDFSPD